VFEGKEYRAATPGGGRLHISNALLEKLLADLRRGESALAFILAREVGHVALGHCRRGWQRVVLEEQLTRGPIARIEPAAWRGVLETKVHAGSVALTFLYSRDQEYEGRSVRPAPVPQCPLPHRRVHRRPAPACRAAPSRGVVPRRFPVAQHRRAGGAVLLPVPGRRSARPAAAAADGARRPGRSAGDFGLFRHEKETGQLVRCRPGDLRQTDQPVVLVHGLHGGKDAFHSMIDYFGERKGLADRPLLVFRHPNNASLARCGQFLFNQVRELLPAAERATFICHSAGGLVFRYYAERLGGGFERAVLLGVPNGGSNLTELKFLIDVVQFVGGLRWGIDAAITQAGRRGAGGRSAWTCNRTAVSPLPGP